MVVLKGSKRYTVTSWGFDKDQAAMVGVISKPDTSQKLEILSDDAKYDLACACGTNREDTRRRGSDGRWIYPVTLPNGGKSVLFKTLISNVCTNDCKYCPLRQDQDIRRCSLSPEETAAIFRDCSIVTWM
jgi:predicted DNA-binding helix-hairpin-helix protein